MAKYGAQSSLRSRLSMRKPMSVRPKQGRHRQSSLGTLITSAGRPQSKANLSLGISATGFGSNKNKSLSGGDHPPGGQGRADEQAGHRGQSGVPSAARPPERPSSCESDVPEHTALHIPRAQQCCRGLFQEEFYWKCSFVMFFFSKLIHVN